MKHTSKALAHGLALLGLTILLGSLAPPLRAQYRDFDGGAFITGTGSELWPYQSIKTVKFNTINNTTLGLYGEGFDHEGDDGSDGYSDFRANFDTRPLDPGSTHTLTVVAFFAWGNWPYYVLTYVDWDQDYLFEESEKIVLSATDGSGSSDPYTTPSDWPPQTEEDPTMGYVTFTADVTVPTGAEIDFVGASGEYRMRVLVKCAASAELCTDTDAPEPNSTIRYLNAEAEDYDLTLSNNLPVELVAFEAMQNDRDVLLSWRTASETNNAGFEVQRRVGAGFETLAFVEGHGTTAEARQYRYTATGLTPGRHVFRLKQIDFDGTFTYSSAVEAQVALPGTYHLSAAYPNPFNPQTRFTLTLQQAQEVRVSVHDVLGREVALLHQGPLTAGEGHSFTFGAAGLPGGLYLIRAEGAQFSAVQPITLVK